MTHTRVLAGIVLCLTTLPLAAQGGRARVKCDIQENGESASGTLVLEKDGKEVASGSCGRAISAPPGDYTAVIGLDGALDGPVQRKPITLQAGAEASVKADFATGTLQVRIQNKGKRAAGMAVIRKDGRQIGTLGSGVAAHLSAGSYQITARYRAQKKEFKAVQVKVASETVLDAAFD